MSDLGSIYPERGEEPPGPDLHAAVQLPRGQLGQPVKVSVPLELPTEAGDVMERALDPAGEGDQITLNLPKDLPDGATLRLRGQGGVVDGGPPGDLYLDIELVDAAPTTTPVGGWLLAAVVLVAAMAGWVLTR